MQEKLIIYLHADELTQPSWAVMNSDGTVRQSAIRDSVSGLEQIAEDKEIIVIVPSEDVLLTMTQLPKMNRSRLNQAVPFALEDELITDVDDLHFAVGEFTSDGVLPVAVVSHEKMQQWLSLLQAWQIKPDVMMPSVLALSCMENVWHIAIGDVALVRINKTQGFACDKYNLVDVLSSALTTASTPSVIRMNNYTNHALGNKLQASLSIPIEEECLSEDKLIHDVARDAEVSTINLLQGAYAVKKSKLPHINKIGKIIASLAVAWVVLLFLYPTISYLILKQRLGSINAHISEIYKRNFPQASNLVAPKIRMQEKLQNINEQMGENRVFLLLGYIGKAVAKTPTIKLNRLDFQNGQLTLDLTAATSDDFSAFTDSLAQQGMNVKQQNANLNGSRINATLLVD